MRLLVCAWFFIFGASLASHACFIAYRLPRGEPVVANRSRCESCGRLLALWEAIPLFGWFICRGRCQSCGCRIPVRYPLFEVSLGSLAVLAYLHSGAFAAVRDILLLGFSLAAALIDYRTMVIPNRLVAAGTVLGLFAGSLTGGLLFSIGGGLLCSALMYAIYLLASGGLGGGDVKFAAVIGVFLGPLGGILSLAIAFTLGGLAAAVLLIIGIADRKQALPLAPWLLAGIVPTIFLRGV